MGLVGHTETTLSYPASPVDCKRKREGQNQKAIVTFGDIRPEAAVTLLMYTGSGKKGGRGQAALLSTLTGEPRAHFTAEGLGGSRVQDYWESGECPHLQGSSNNQFPNP